ncbi:MAG: hypothetical protein ABW190_10950 [Rhizobacter sp.]
MASVVSQPVAAQTSNWVTCGNEGGRCTFSGTQPVRYGAGNRWSATRSMTAVNGGIDCNNVVFGDPAVGVVKQCQIDTANVSVTWRVCGSEGGTCTFTGTQQVRYGANSTWSTPRTFTASNGGVACNNAVFGDPLPMVVKQCQVTAGNQTPTPPGNGLPTIASFSASATSVTAGDAVTLRWSASNATSVSIDKGVGVVTGASVEVRPTETTTYTLTATTAVGSVRITVTLTVSPLPATALLIDRTTKFQTIEGFGFFGPKNNWWDSNDPSAFFDATWLDRVVDDLGITMWRNELQPNNPVASSTSVSLQDATWSKQRPMITALKAKADASRVPLKFLLTIWSPPGEWKLSSQMSWVGDNAATRGGRHPGGTKNGGTLDPARYGDYASWLNSGLQLYRDAGIDVYGLSLQNEPAFIEPYNSAVYTASWYGDLLENVVPRVKARFPNVRIFGSENMLELEAASNNYQWFYHSALRNRPNALRQMDRWAVHGYSDGVAATAVARHRDLWERHYQQFQQPSGKPGWMTETSGYNSEWDTANTDAFDLGIAMHAALYYGKTAAWVYWAADGDLMPDGTPVKQYHVAKQFYRFIRPDARMVSLTSPDAEVLGAAFEHTGLSNFVVVLINQSAVSKTLSLAGGNVPADFDAYRTSRIENAVSVGKMNRTQVVLPPKSITTLVNGRFRE